MINPPFKYLFWHSFIAFKASSFSEKFTNPYLLVEFSEKNEDICALITLLYFS